MTKAASPLPLRSGGGDSRAVRLGNRRREPRVPAVDPVEYSPFPRVQATQGRRMGFMRNRSDSGMCLEVGSAPEVGSLLQVSVRSIDGRQMLRALARVVWCEDGEEGNTRVGLSLVKAPPARCGLARVRPERARAPRRLS